MLREIYKKLFEVYGRQGWWPLISRAGTPGFDKMGYHRGLYLNKLTPNEVFEISLGAILTQNTAWKNAEQAILRLKENNLLSAEKVAELSASHLATLIKPAGYFNQKARKIKLLSRFFIKLKRIPSREELLSLWGVGKETADSILLYAFNQPFFVVDAYTRRILSSRGIITGDEEYDEIRTLFESCLGKDIGIYQEYHALLVEHGKRYYSRKPYGKEDKVLA